MPMYEYRCVTCGREGEELQKHSDPPPIWEGICSGPPPELDDDGNPIAPVPFPEQPCDPQRVPSTCTSRFPHGTYSNDGRAGWERQGAAMVRKIKGRESTKYGEGTV